MYDVYLDDIYFYGVTDFDFSGSRELIVYNGIGTGYFPKADDPDLKNGVGNVDCRISLSITTARALLERAKSSASSTSCKGAKSRCG